MMKNPELFRMISSPAEFVRNGLEIGELTKNLYKKSARIHAVPGTPGERVVTILKNGLEETVNTVSVDLGTGTPDWIVTAPSGEQYIVTDKTFQDKYCPDPKEPGAFIPKGKPVEAVQIHEDIRFVAPWGEEQLLASGGYLILDPGGIYGVAEEEFMKTYSLVEGSKENIKFGLDLNIRISAANWLYKHSPADYVTDSRNSILIYGNSELADALFEYIFTTAYMPSTNATAKKPIASLSADFGSTLLYTSTASDASTFASSVSVPFTKS